ncbi:MAG: amidase [Acidobacteria bacterium]|nr:amidase [Acidobacteriota bacterium]
MTILEAAAALRAGTVSSKELTQQCLAAIDKNNTRYNAFLTVTGDFALAQAAQADIELASGTDRGPLHGIPIALKDVFSTKGIRTTCGSLLYKDHVPDFDCAVAEKLYAAGAVMVGKAHQHEMAYGVTSNNPHFGPVRNPWNVDCVPGGSSGGSGAAVTAGMAFMAMGSDTGGSIRIPASFCNTVGLKPTHGRVSRYGVLPLDFTLDHMGPMTRSVRDAAVCLNALAGRDPRDETSSYAPVEDFLPPAQVSLQGVRIGIPEAGYYDRLEPAVLAATRHTIQTAAALGARVTPVETPSLFDLNTIGRVILLSEASAFFERYTDRKHLVGDDVRTLWDQGLLLSATDYINAQRLRRQYCEAFRRVFDSVDVLITPCAPATAKRIGDTTVTIDGVAEDFRLATTRFVRGINVLGFPAISIPCGFDGERMPIGAQLIAKPFAERQLLEVAAALEDASSFHRELPPGL